MALPVVVQAPNAVLVSGATTGQVTMGSAVQAGNSLIGGVGAAAIRSWTVTDTVDGGSWSSDVLIQPAESAQIHHRHSASAGTPTITWTVNTGTFTGWVWAAEVSGLDTGASAQTGSLDEGSNSTSHNCNATALTATDAFGICSGVLNTAATTTVAGGSYTIAPTLSSNRYLIQYQVNASFNDSGPWTSTGSARQGTSVMAVFAAPAGSAGHPTKRPFRVNGPRPFRVNQQFGAAA